MTQETNDVVTQELIERLRARRKRELTLSLTGVAWEPLINPDGPEAADALQAQSARIAELREAMKPFAIYADIQDDHRRSADEGFCSTTVHGSTGKTTRITCGDLRRARASLTKDSTSVTG